MTFFKQLGCCHPHYLAAFIGALLIIGLQVFNKPLREPHADEFVYLQIASDLIKSDTHTDGPFAKNQKEKEPGRFFSPLYPGFLNLMARLDDNVSVAIQCHKKNKTKEICGGSFQSVVTVQVVFAVISLMFIFTTAQLLSGSFFVAWLAMIIAAATGEISFYARYYLTENLAFLGFYGLLLFLVSGYIRDKSNHFLIAGLFIGIATLSRPSYAYLYYLLIPTLFILLVWAKKKSLSQAIKAPALFALGGMLLLAPWLIRNHIQFGDMALTEGYGSFILLQRLAYNMMSWSEWGVFFIQGLPDFGDKLSRGLFSHNLWERLDYFNEDVQTFYEVGNSSAWKAQLIPTTIPNDQQSTYLVKTYIFGDLFKHTMVTIPISLRGMWAGGYLALIGVAFAWPVGKLMKKKERLIPYFLLVMPSLFMVGLHGFVSVNVVRYNVPMIAVYSVICALFIRHLIDFSPQLSRLAVRFDGQQKT